MGPRTEQPDWHHLPRLSPELYRGFAVLMPDQAHLIWMGLRVETDQRNAMKFLRKHLAEELRRRSPNGVEFELQKQSHDSVLRPEDRLRNAFEKACFYILDNPRRKGLVKHPRHWRTSARSSRDIRFCIRWLTIFGNYSGKFT